MVEDPTNSSIRRNRIVEISKEMVNIRFILNDFIFLNFLKMGRV